MDELAHGICAAHGARAEVIIEETFTVLNNHSQQTEYAVNAAQAIADCRTETTFKGFRHEFAIGVRESLCFASHLTWQFQSTPSDVHQNTS